MLISNSVFSFKVHQNIATLVSRIAVSSEEHEGKLSSSVTVNYFFIFCCQRSNFIADIGSIIYYFYWNKTSKVWNNITLNQLDENTPSVSKSFSTTEEVYQDVNDRMKLKGRRSKTGY